ncbi:MAG: TIGR03617 family F420-dependent LLM class oxidoreductase [Anaerolineae bacterium]|nr:MAG: TIGR03617 family F420-dependent LLM class oxidoreductase [Anaerolineae bacterium]
MNLDTFLDPSTPLGAVPELARHAETLGFGCVWAAETQHNPFLACALIAANTTRIDCGTGIAVSFARSPAVMAHTSWDLADLSGGRFRLGLGTQVKAHIERRFGMAWPESVTGKLREQIQAVRAFWANWQTGEKLNQRGEYYKLTLTSPFFTPDKPENPRIPIYIAGVNTGLARLAGELADGFHVHPYHSPEYLRATLLPAMETGAAKAGRTLKDVDIVVNAFTVSNPHDDALARMQIAFYASTPSYRAVMAHHGWADVAERLSAHAAKQEWAKMPGLITDAMLNAFATVAEEADLAAALHERYAGIADRVTIYIPLRPGERDGFWTRLVGDFEKMG